jgi:hypothetical protein
MTPEEKKRYLQLSAKDKEIEETGGGDEDGGTEAGGKTGAIEFRYKDPLLGPARDDLLAPQEINRLLIVHQDVHKEHVRKQQQTREDRLALKEGRQSILQQRARQGLGGGGSGISRFKKHPISDKAQFSGIVDKKVIGVPSEAETNAELQDKLENKYQNKYVNTPKFNPRPRFPGG